MDLNFTLVPIKTSISLIIYQKKNNKNRYQKLLGIKINISGGDKYAPNNLESKGGIILLYIIRLYYVK